MAKDKALLDTTIQVDRNKFASRRNYIENILSNYEWKFTTSICLLEFKATIIQECITIHDKLYSAGKFTLVRDYLTESSHRQTKLRNHIFQNLINVYASSFDVTDENDRLLAEQARLQLEVIIPRLYKWFINSVDSVLKEEIECTRALQEPKKKRVAFEVNIPNCKRGQNKSCHIEEFIRTKAVAFTERLEAILLNSPEEESSQLKKACELFKQVISDNNFELSNSACRSAGDCLIALEGRCVATHGLSTNAKEWKAICELIPFEFVRIQYPNLEKNPIGRKGDK